MLVLVSMLSRAQPIPAYALHYVISTFRFRNGNVNFNYFQGVLMTLGINQYT